MKTLSKTIIFLLAGMLLLASSSLAENRHLPASSRTTISEDMGFAMILQAMSINERVLQAVQLSAPDERAAVGVIADFETHFRELSDALDNGQLTRREFCEARDHLTEAARANLRVKLSHTNNGA